MTPGIFPITVYRSSPFDLPLTLADTDGIAVDLSELAPFYAQCRNVPGGTLLLSFTVVETDLANGQLNLTTTVEETASLVLGQNMWDLIDSVGNRWIEGPAEFSNQSITQLPA